MPHTAASSMATKRPLHASNLADCFRKGANRVVLVIIVFFTRLLCATKLSIFPELSEGKAGKIQVGLRNTIRSFNPLRRAIERVSAIAGGQLCINPRPHGGATAARSAARSDLRFNPRPHGGGRLNCSVINYSSFCFNPRPHGGATPGSKNLVESGGFNPRPHGGGDSTSVLRCVIIRVSIHAPTGGATILTTIV